MKKIFCIMILCIFIILITGCGKDNLNLNDTYIVTYHDLNIKLPKKFIKSSGDDLTIFYEFPYNDDACHLSISQIFSSEDLEKSIKSDFRGNDYTTSTKNINNKVWTIGKGTINNNQIMYVYAIDYNNIRYRMIYDYYLDNESVCEEVLNKVENSMQFK